MPNVSERRFRSGDRGRALVKAPDAQLFLNWLFERYRKSITQA
jgi:hypothetical protein